MDNYDHQPPFWLQVRKEYVIENFEELRTYLAAYRYDAGSETADSDYNKSYECLHQVVADLAADLQTDSLCHNATSQWGDRTQLNIRMIATYLLAGQKRGIDDHEMLCRLTDLLLLCTTPTATDCVRSMHRIVMGCIERRRVASYGFGWGDLTKREIGLDQFATLLAQTTFEPGSDNNSAYYCEHRGVMSVSGGYIEIASMNHHDYQKEKLQAQLDIAGLYRVMVRRRDYAKRMPMSKLKELRRDLSNEQSTVKPSPVVMKKTYESGDELYVRILDLDSLNAVSADPNYETRRGKILLRSQIYGIEQDLFLRHLRTDEYLRVTLTDVPNQRYTFDLAPELERFYIDEAEKACGSTCDAVFLEHYSKGKRWITDTGLIVNIFGDPTPEAEEAIRTGATIRIYIQEHKKDKSNHEVVNGRYRTEDAPTDDSRVGYDFIQHAHINFIDNFLDEYTAGDDFAPAADTQSIPTWYAGVMAHLLYYTSGCSSRDTEERYRALIAAQMLATIGGSEADQTFIAHETAYLNVITDFVSGTDTQPRPTLTHGSLLDGIPRVTFQDEVVAALDRYQDPIIAPTRYRSTQAAGDIDYLKNLISASNTLNGKINISEINRIKKSIAEFLGVADMFSNIYREQTFYGEESDTLELKSSLVYPSDNKMQASPTTQLWAILKQIYGFLNTVNGGEILIGVNDQGYACGLDGDLKYLYENHIVREQHMDKLRMYLKLQVDKAFTDDQNSLSGTDITATRINYTIERSSEGVSILRIQVRPYEYGIVQFSDSTKRPDDIMPSYYRTSGSTQPMTSDMRVQVLEKKASIIQDEEVQKAVLIRKAIREHCTTTLVGYSSSSGKRDRMVEAYQILPTHKSIVAYDPEKKKVCEFKLVRAERIELTKQKWRYQKQHQQLRIDIFGMLETPGKAPTHIKLKLSCLATNLIREEHPMADQYLHDNSSNDQETYPTLLETDVYSLLGVGRFCIGLAHDICVVEGTVLTEYIRDYMTKALEQLSSNHGRQSHYA